MNETDETQAERPTYDTLAGVVGIGASAGGLEALEAMFNSAPADLGLAYVVVTHLSPNFKSLMDELLARHTRMPVQLVEDGITIRPNQVYVIPPKVEMIVVAGQLLLSDREPGPQLALPIDTFFRSLAREYGRRSIAVVLSGTGGDGSHALEAVRDVGGRVIVQDPETAKFDGMPKAAIATGMAHDVLSPKEIGESLARKPVSEVMQSVHGDADPEQAELSRIFAALYGTSSIDFEAYKTTTVLRRIDRRMASRRSPSLLAYAALVEEEPREAEALSRDLLIGVTQFFRDEEAFESLAEKVIPPLINDMADDRSLRIWVPGCATGEEAYSVAMLVRQQLDDAGSEGEVQIFATDLQRDFVDHAGRGIFEPSEFPDAFAHLRSRYMIETEDGKLQVVPDVRRMVVFAHHNVLSDPPFTRLDLVTCRNMLIYLQPEAQARVLSLLSFGVRRGGFLFLGPSESLVEFESSFSVINKRWRIFRKDQEAGDFQMPERKPPKVARDSKTGTVVPAGNRRVAMSSRREIDLLPAYGTLLERYAPPGVLIDGDRQLVHTFGDARDYLRPPVGLASLDILDMVPEGLRLAMATAIDRVNREGREVRYEGAVVNDAMIDVTVFPTAGGVEGRRSYKVILIDVRGQDDDRQRAVEVLDADSISVARIEDLEGELRYTRENLQATIEEVETSNEELQSTNEELMAANEELQSTNEELHSVNEELYSVNAEYQRKNDELIQLNRDMEALMTATDVGVIFVDEKLAVRRFTSPAKRVFNLIEEDKGRSLSHLTHALVDADVAAIARRAVDQFLSSEHELQAQDGTWWLLRCMPMKTPGSNAIGAILTAVDIDEFKRSQLKLEQEARRQRLITELGNAFVVGVDAEFSMVQPNAGWEAFTGQSRAEYRGRGWTAAIHPDDLARIRAQFDVDNPHVADFDVLYRLWHARTRSYRHCQVYMRPEDENSDEITGWIGAVVDVEEAVQSEQTVRRSEQMLRSIMDDMPGLFAMMDTDRRYTFANEGYQKRWGQGVSLIGRHVNDVLTADVMANVQSYLNAAYEGDIQEFMFDRVTPEGEAEVILGIYSPTHDSQGEVNGVAVFGQNVSRALDNLDRTRSLEENFGQIVLKGTEEHLLVDRNSLRIVLSSKGAQTNLRRDSREMGRLTLVELLPEFDAEALEQHIAANAEGRHGAVHQTFVLRGDGSSYDASVTFTVDPSPESDLVAVGFQDISDQRKINRTLRDRNEELARSNSDLENFAHFASHDLQEPARKIGSFAELIGQDLSGDATDDVREYLDIISRASERMLMMVQDLLNFSRVRAAAEKFEPVDLNEIVREVAGDEAADLKEAGGTLNRGKLPAIRGDKGLLYQLFKNLVGNAIKYRDADRPLEISINAGTGENGHMITVTDNGMGFDQENEEIIFGLFQRLHSPTGIPGSGVGLAICKRVTELHGGEIGATSEVGRGTTFTITLPDAEGRGRVRF